MDGLRAVWEPTHLATIKLDPSKVEVFSTSPNEALRVNTAAATTDNTVSADVGDGCHPAFTTILGPKTEGGDFRESLIKAKITERDNRCTVPYGVPHMDPVTTLPSDD